MNLYLDLIGDLYFELEPWCPNRGGRIEGHFHLILGVLKFFPDNNPFLRLLKPQYIPGTRQGRFVRDVLCQLLQQTCLSWNAE